MIKFQYYNNNAKNPNPLGIVSLKAFLNGIRNPRDETKVLLGHIKTASEKNDLTLKAELKTKLFSFTPCVIVKERRAYSDIESFTGLTVLDFDKIDYAPEFKNFLFNTYGSIIAAWLSPSGKGVKAFVKIPVVKTIEQYKKYFYGLASEMEIYNGFDGTTQNAVLPLFIGWDKDILVREDYTTWNITGTKRNSFTAEPNVPVVESSNKQTQWVINWYTNKINDIVDNGHPQLIANSVSLGGYVGGGLIDYNEALNLARRLIEQNGYLQKGVSGYIKTAESAIKLGTSKPLTFN